MSHVHPFYCGYGTLGRVRGFPPTRSEKSLIAKLREELKTRSGVKGIAACSGNKNPGNWRSRRHADAFYFTAGINRLCQTALAVVTAYFVTLLACAGLRCQQFIYSDAEVVCHPPYILDPGVFPFPFADRAVTQADGLFQVRNADVVLPTKIPDYYKRQINHFLSRMGIIELSIGNSFFSV